MVNEEETLVVRFERELKDFFSLWGRNWKLALTLVLALLLYLGYTIWPRPKEVLNPTSLATGRIALVKVLADAFNAGKKNYSYFVRLDDDNWYEFSEDTQNHSRFKFKQMKLDSTGLELIDDNRWDRPGKESEIWVKLKFDFSKNQIFYMDNTAQEYRKQYDIIDVRTTKRE